MYPGVIYVRRGFLVDHLLLNTFFGAIIAREGLGLTVGTLKERGRMDVPLLRICHNGMRERGLMLCI